MTGNGHYNDIIMFSFLYFLAQLNTMIGNGYHNVNAKIIMLNQHT